MFINISYRKDDGAFGIGKYSYKCDIPDVAVGDLVIAPTSNGERTAKVVEINVPESKIDERIMSVLKTITQREVTDENS